MGLLPRMIDYYLTHKGLRNLQSILKDGSFHLYLAGEKNSQCRTSVWGIELVKWLHLSCNDEEVSWCRDFLDLTKLPIGTWESPNGAEILK